MAGKALLHLRLTETGDSPQIASCIQRVAPLVFVGSANDYFDAVKKASANRTGDGAAGKFTSKSAIPLIKLRIRPFPAGFGALAGVPRLLISI